MNIAALERALGAIIANPDPQHIFNRVVETPELRSPATISVILDRGQKGLLGLNSNGILNLCWSIVNAMTNIANELYKAGQTDLATGYHKLNTEYEKEIIPITRQYNPVWPQIAFDRAESYRHSPYFDRNGCLELGIWLYEDALKFVDKSVDPNAWASINNSLGIAYHERQSGDRAENLKRSIACFNEVLAIRTFDADPVGWARAKINLANIYNRMGDDATNVEIALSHFAAASQVITKDFDAQLWGVLRGNMGNSYMVRDTEDDADDIDAAILCFTDAASVQDVDRDPVEWAKVTNNMAGAYSHRRNGDRGENLNISNKLFGSVVTTIDPNGDPKNAGIAYQGLGNNSLADTRGDANERAIKAISYFEEALKYRTPTRDPRAWERSVIAFTKLLSGSERGDRSECVERLISYLHRIDLSNAIPNVKAALFNLLAIAYFERRRESRVDNLERALTFMQDAIAIATDVPELHQTLGNIYRRRLRGDRANNCERAIESYETVLAAVSRQDDPTTWAEAQDGLGKAYEERLHGNSDANIENAIKCLSAALEVFTPELNGHRWAETTNSLGNCLAIRKLGIRSINLFDASCYHREALEYFRDHNLKEAYFRTANNLALVYAKIGTESATKSAIDLFKEVLTFRTPESDPFGWANASLNLASAYLQADDFENASNYYKNALLTAENALPIDLVLQALAGQATAMIELGRYAEAIAPLERGIERLVRSRIETVTNEARQPLLRTLSQMGRHLAFAQIRCGNFNAAIEAIETCRAVSLRETLETQRFLDRLSESDRLVLRELQQEIANTRAQMAAGRSAANGQAFQEMSTLLAAAETRLFAFVTKRGYEPMGKVGGTLILASVPPDTTLVVPFSTRWGGFVFVIPSETETIQEDNIIAMPALNSAFVADLAGAHLKSVHSFKLARDDVIGADGPISLPSAETVTAPLVRLWDALMGSVVMAVRARVLATPLSKLIILPTAEFAALPLHAACDATGKCIADDFIVSYTPSIAALRLRRPHREVEDVQDEQRLLALINPTNDLPHSEQIELPALTRYFPAKGTRKVLVGDDARKDTLIDLAGDCTHLHLSCHAEFDWRDPEQAGLRLSNGERLTVPEIAARLDLSRCEVVLLSACETGVVDVALAPDESVGQVAAFRQAGAECVVASLWVVADNAAALFAERFYKGHIEDDLEPAMATREAVRWLRELTWDEYKDTLASSGAALQASPWFQARGFPKLTSASTDAFPHDVGTEKPFASPFYWAAFAAWTF